MSHPKNPLFHNYFITGQLSGSLSSSTAFWRHQSLADNGTILVMKLYAQKPFSGLWETVNLQILQCHLKKKLIKCSLLFCRKSK